jgi:hypothetical protein
MAATSNCLHGEKIEAEDGLVCAQCGQWLCDDDLVNAIHSDSEDEGRGLVLRQPHEDRLSELERLADQYVEAARAKKSLEDAAVAVTVAPVAKRAQGLHGPTYRRVYYLHVRLRRIFDDDPRLPVEDVALVVGQVQGYLSKDGGKPTQSLIKRACRELVNSCTAPEPERKAFRLRMERVQRKWLQVYYSLGGARPPGSLLQYNALVDGLLPAVEHRLLESFKPKQADKRWFLPGGYDTLLLLFTPELGPWLRLTGSSGHRSAKFAQWMKTELPTLRDFCRQNSLVWEHGLQDQTT